MVNCIWIKQISKDDIPLVGGKASNLGELASNKFPVPGGFVVTAEAYKLFLDKTGIQKEINEILDKTDINNTDELKSSSEKIQDLILSTDMPPEVKLDIQKYYKNVNTGTDITTLPAKAASLINVGRDLPFVAARSSATAEDLPSISKDEDILVKINNRMYFRRMEEIYDIVGTGENYIIEIPAMVNNKIEWVKAKRLYKHKANNDKIYKIVTETGREVIVSPNHTLIVLDENKLEPKEVESIYYLRGDEKLPAINSLPIIDLKQDKIDILDYIDPEGVVNNNGVLKIVNNSNNWKIQQGLSRKLKITKDFAYFLGVYCAEGSLYGNNEIIITNSDNKVMKRIINYTSSLDLYSGQKINKNSLRVYNKILLKFLKSVSGKPNDSISVKGKLSRKKKVPEFIFGWNKELIGEFLRGCFDGDGFPGKNVLQYTSTSKRLISGIIKLLEMLGIRWYLREVRSTNSYDLTISPKSYELFSKYVSFEIDRKRKRLDNLITDFNKKKNHPEFLDNIKVSKKLSSKIRDKFEESLIKNNVKKYFCNLCNLNVKKTSYNRGRLRFYCRNCSKVFYENDVICKNIKKHINYDEKGRFVKNSIPWNKSKINKKLSFDKFRNHLDRNNINYSLHDSVKWDSIKSIEKINYDDYVYDFCVPGVENFAAGVGGIITHNSASFAGQQATYLNIKGQDNVVQAVHQCWASLYTARAIYYRETNNFEHAKVYIAVVVQKMVNSEKSGVMFTIDPVTNDENKVIIEAGFGLGDAIVSGAISPNRYVVDKNNWAIMDKKIPGQDWMFTRDINTGRTKKQALSDDKSKKQVLSDGEIVALAKLSRKIEKHYGNPQDIEYAVEDNRLYIVQTRAVTTQKKVEEVKEEVKEEIEGEVVLEGLSASPGVGSGPVKIVHGLEDLNKIEKGNILVTKMTNPDMVPAMERASAIVTDEGGSTCHAAIVSRELGIPAVVGTEKATQVLKENTIVSVDGSSGKIYSGKVEVEEKEEITIEDVNVDTVTKIKVNVDLPQALEKAKSTNPDGVGLVRLEFMIAEKGVHPARYIRDGRQQEYTDFLVSRLRDIAQSFEGKPVWIRTSDIRSDEYRELEGGDIDEKESNPMMGWHAIRRGLDEQGILKAELKAVKKLKEEGLNNIAVMLPLITHVEQVTRTKDIMRDMSLECDLGIMVETPAAVEIIDELASTGIKFASIGSNDLTQFVLAVDRNNAKVQSLYNELHPAVLKQIKRVVKRCKELGVESSICGQAGSNPEMAKQLVKFGIDSISANIDAVGKIKKIVAEEEKKMLLDAARRE